MAISAKNPVVIVVGVFFAFSAVNSATHAVTGFYVTEIGDAEVMSANNEAVELPEDANLVAPLSVVPTRNYGTPGRMWSSGHHTGIDFPVSTGTAVHAAADGTVVTVSSGGSYGQQIVIRHSDKLYTQYAHLSRFSVSSGDTVRAGQEIGFSGNTGNSTGPHLHFEVRTGPKYGTDINPLPLIGR